MRYLIFLSMALSSPVSLAETIRSNSEATIVKPLGMWEHRQPPPRNKTVVIADPKIDFSAQQVCGYTDWTTAAIQVPKDILTADYWGKNLENAKNEAVDSLLAISGALPSMLACNASPTFCHVLNQAKALAQSELSFTMDSCKVLDGLANQENLQNEGLRACIQDVTSSRNFSARQAREFCITGGDVGPGKEKAFQNVAGEVTRDIYSSEIFEEAACKESKSQAYNSSHFSYTVSKKSCEWLAELFPGVTVKAKASLLTGGTFQPVAEKKYTETVRKTNDYLVEIVDIMHRLRYGLPPYASTGPLPPHKVLKHPDLAEKLGLDKNGKLKALCVRGSGDSCEADIDQIPPVYRLSADGTEPVLLIDPATVFELVSLVGPNSTADAEFSKRPSHLELIITRLSQAASYTKTNDVLSATLSRTLKACKGHPDLSSASAQKDCNLKISLLEAEKNSLATRRETDKDFLIAQMQFYKEVERAKAAMLPLRAKQGSTISRDDPKDPSTLK